MREQGGETREEQRWEGGGRRHETRRDSAHPKLYGKEYGTNGRQPARAHVHEDVSIMPDFLNRNFTCLPILYPPEILPHQKQGILMTTVFVALGALKSLGGLEAIDHSLMPRTVNKLSSTYLWGHDISTVHGSIHYLNDLVITMSLCYSMYAFWFKPPSLPDATDIGNTGWNWNCGPMSLCLCGGVSLDDLLH
ncbi:hypothetical protein B0H10DRAFT_1940745 [Mycena sp. CBHHK59/15]|nr:hypothetical protein B0H10DRAFT_1940745 [Mycena sp. CBHHK59/15]